jgi:2-(1,2-epoxy-1,2-dihydrophenyl)acetyl-CoA isomerase
MTSPEQGTPVLVRRDEGVVTLELNRPKRKNGLTGEMVDALIHHLDEISANASDRVVVLTGAGDAFCSGMDLGAPIKPDELTFMRRVAALAKTLYHLPKPTIAKINGPAVGFGANIGFCCDLILASERARFAEVFRQRGLTVDGGGSWFLPRLIGMAKAKEVLFFGHTFDAYQAEELGLVNKTVAEAELDSVCQDWAQLLASGPPRALSTMKGLLNNADMSTFDQAIEAEAVAQALSFRSPEVKEGMTALREKREPNFR